MRRRTGRALGVSAHYGRGARRCACSLEVREGVGDLQRRALDGSKEGSSWCIPLSLSRKARTRRGVVGLGRRLRGATVATSSTTTTMHQSLVAPPRESLLHVNITFFRLHRLTISPRSPLRRHGSGNYAESSQKKPSCRSPRTSSCTISRQISLTVTIFPCASLAQAKYLRPHVVMQAFTGRSYKATPQDRKKLKRYGLPKL
jgi:hypothetical protein